MKEKPKRRQEKLSNFNRVQFFLLWIVLATLTSSISHNIFLWLLDVISQFMGENFMRDSYWRMVLLDALLLSSLIAPVEKILLKLSFGQWIKGWISARILSTVISVMPFIVLREFNLQDLVLNNPQNMLQIGLISALAALPQVWVLRPYVQKSWLYLIAATGASLLPIFIVPTVLGATLGASFTIGSSATVIAIMMLWFFRQVPEEPGHERGESQAYERLEDNLSEMDETPDEYFDATLEDATINQAIAKR